MCSFLRRNLPFFVFLVLGLLAGTAVWLVHGPEAFHHAIDHALGLFGTILPTMLAGLLLAASLRQFVGPGALARWMGTESGWRGLLVANIAGVATPGGPMAAFPLVLVLARAGADRGALIIYVFAWGLNGFHRVLVYEVPLLGPDFAALRFAATVLLPMLAGFLARRIPIAWTPPAPGDAAPPTAMPERRRR